MASQPIVRMTEEEYLARERAAEYKSEYIDGEVFAMAGTSLRHARIVTNLTIELGNKLEGTPCSAFVTDVRLRIPPARVYTYPDISVVCGPPAVAGDRQDTLLNPAVLIEVLPDSTRNYDRGEKFGYYRRIESLRDYLVVEQDAMHVEHHQRQDDGAWTLREYDGPDAEVKFASIGCSLSLARIYRDLESLK
ncbi:MAG: Uma2 family endonuclease [Bryobacteraceae bacterium]